MLDSPLLIADIGGTNARFALARHDAVGFTDAMTLQCADFPTSIAAIHHYLELVSAQSPAAICLAAAGPVIGDELKVTNNDWNLAGDELRKVFGTSLVKLLNDFEAIAWSIPHIEDDVLDTVGPVSRELPGESFSVAVVGPGTGLGAGGLCKRAGVLAPVVGEGGHIGFAPESELQIALLNVLRNKFERVTVERLLSGAGVENIYLALSEVRGEERDALSAAAIFAAAGDDSDGVAVDTANLFFEVLGQVAGDIALTFGALDGVYLAGGIVKRYPELMHASDFRSAFENKGKHQSMMEHIPTMLITYDEPGLLGAAYCALELSGIPPKR